MGLERRVAMVDTKKFEMEVDFCDYREVMDMLNDIVVLGNRGYQITACEIGDGVLEVSPVEAPQLRRKVTLTAVLRSMSYKHC